MNVLYEEKRKLDYAFFVTTDNFICCLTSFIFSVLPLCHCPIHGCVSPCVKVMASKTKIYIVMELVTGGELFDKIVSDWSFHPHVNYAFNYQRVINLQQFLEQASRGRLKENDARKYFQQLINAVDYCHSRGVYHRDLKVSAVYCVYRYG